MDTAYEVSKVNSPGYMVFYNKTISEAASRIHPGRGAFLSLLFYAQWGLVLQVTTLEYNYELTYGQVRRKINLSCPILTVFLDCVFAFIPAHCRRMPQARFPGASPADSSLPSSRIFPAVAQPIQETIER